MSRTNVVSTRNAEHYTWGDGWHLLTSSGLSVIQERVPPGGGEVAHHHERAHLEPLGPGLAAAP